MKQIVTFRLDPDLLAKARHSARRENRTLTNFVETLLKQAVDGPAPAGRPMTSADSSRPN